MSGKCGMGACIMATLSKQSVRSLILFTQSRIIVRSVPSSIPFGLGLCNRAVLSVEVC